MPLTLSSLYQYPLKSCRGNLVDQAVVEPEGLSRDRRFLAHTADGTFISGRSHPPLVRITVDWDGVTARFQAPGREPLVVRPEATVGASVAVWNWRFPAWDQGDEAARWLSSYLGDQVRMAWLGTSARVLHWDQNRRVTFADVAPCLAIGTASLGELSRRVGEELSMRRFRPNLVIDGAEPFEEDTWRRIQVGSVEFQLVDGCGRCEFTTVDPETGEKHPRKEPVATLETFRKVDTGIYFGMNLMPLSGGTIRVGDPVTVLKTRRPLYFGTDSPWHQGGEPEKLPAWPEGAAELRCTAVRDEARGVKTFSLVREDGLRWSHRAGQYLTLKLGPLRRSYTISSAPSAAGAVEVTVKRLEGGQGSTWLHDHLNAGSVVVGEAVGGSFTLEDHPWASLLFLGAGAGMTPLIAMLREIAARDWPVDVAVHQSARTRVDALFADELVRLRGLLGARLTIALRITSEEGRLDRQSLLDFCPDVRDRKAFVCGPDGYRASMRGLLASTGMKIDRRYHEELFGEAALEVPDDAVPGTVTFARTGKAVVSDGRTTVLQLVERAGIDLPSSCRSGDCGACRVKTAAGEWVLACHTFPKGDLSLEL